MVNVGKRALRVEAAPMTGEVALVAARLAADSVEGSRTRSFVR